MSCGAAPAQSRVAMEELGADCCQGQQSSTPGGHSIPLAMELYSPLMSDLGMRGESGFFLPLTAQRPVGETTHLLDCFFLGH